VRGFLPGDEARLIELYEICFEKKRSGEELAWLVQRAPQPTQFRIATIDDRIVGAMYARVFPMWMCGEISEMDRGGDLMVDPAHRGRGISKLLRGAERPPTRALSIHFPRGNIPPLKSRRIGRLTQWVRWEQPTALREDAPWLPVGVSRVAVAATRVAARGASFRHRRIRCCELSPENFAGEEAALDALDLRSGVIAPFVMRRDAAHVRWRWLDRPDPWRVVVASDVGGDPESVIGYVAFTVLDSQCRIGDILAFDPATMGALIRAVTKSSSPERPGRTLFELNDPRPWPAKVLRLAGFLPRGEGPQVSVRLTDERLPESLVRLSSFYLTAGDTDLA